MLHAENKNIKQLYPLLSECLSIGLSSKLQGNKSFEVTPYQNYVCDVCSRVFEIDNAFRKLSLSLEYLSNKIHPDSKYGFSIHHSYHIEVFLLKLSSVVDRCFLLSGSSVLLADETIECIGGNNIVIRELKKISPQSVEILRKIDKTISGLKDKRNEVAHKAGYSNNNLSLLRANEVMSKETTWTIDDINAVQELTVTESINQLSPILSTMHELVDELINSLGFIYSKVIDKTCS